MPGTPLSSKTASLYVGKQSEKGTAATSLTKLRWLSGNITTEKDLNAQEILDGETFSNAFDYTNLISGKGTLSVECDAKTLGLLVGATLAGTDTVTGEDAPFTHVQVPGAARPYLTIVKTVGEGDAVIREQYVDCKVVNLTISASAADKVVVAEFEVASLNPGINLDADPTGYDEVEEPFLYTDGEGAYVVGGDTVAAINQFRLQVATGEELWQGDGVRGYTMVAGVGSISLDATLLAEDGTIGVLKQHLYGTATPAANAEPVSTVYFDTFELNLSKGTGEGERQFQVEVPKLRYSVDSPDPSADGGAVEIAVSGEVRAPSTGDRVTVTIKSADDTAY